MRVVESAKGRERGCGVGIREASQPVDELVSECVSDRGGELQWLLTEGSEDDANVVGGEVLAAGEVAS